MSLLAKMTCPRPEMLGEFLDDQLDEIERATIEAHLDSCDECRPVVALLVKTARQYRDDKTDAMAATAVADLVATPAG